MSEYKESTYDRIGQDGKDTEDTYEGVNRMPNDEWFKSLGMKPIISTRKSKLIHMNKFNKRKSKLYQSFDSKIKPHHILYAALVALSILAFTLGFITANFFAVK